MDGARVILGLDDIETDERRGGPAKFGGPDTERSYKDLAGVDLIFKGEAFSGELKGLYG